MLKIDNLHVSVDTVEVLKGLTLHVPAGQVHAIMGPNGAGKSTLSAVLAGHEGYTVTQGSVLFHGNDLLAMPPEERASAGLFLALQYPPEIPGVAGMVFMRTALNALRVRRGEDEIAAPAFLKQVKAAGRTVGLSDEMLKRAFNVGFSGGEKKRAEVLQLLLAQPSLAILDEIDSGLDMDALKNIASALNTTRTPQRSLLLITHYRRLLDMVTPDVVHILADGRIARSGGSEVIDALETAGYDAALHA